MLENLGFEVVTIEKHSFYAGEYEKIADGLKNRGIRFLDLDILADPLPTGFDAVLLLAVIEHLNGTPRFLLQKCGMMLNNPSSLFFLGVPNAAYLWKRLRFLVKGKAPFPDIEHVYWSDYPFAGHNREYTTSDVRKVLEWGGWTIERIETFDYYLPTLPNRICQLFATPNGRQTILAIARKLTT